MKDREKKRGPSCLSCILLLAAIVFGLKFVYRVFPRTETEEPPLPELSEPQSEPQENEKDVSLPELLEPLRNLFGRLTERRKSAAKPETAVQESELEEQPEPLTQEELREALYEALRDGAETATFSYDCTGTLFETFRSMCGRHPELFWLDGGGNMQMSTLGSRVTVTFRPGRTMNTAEIWAAKTELELAAEKILREIPADASDYERVLFIHDRLVTDTDYDHEAAGSFEESGASLGMSANAYGCLVKHRAVCSGYAAAFRLLMNEIDVPCLTVTGFDNRSGLPHAWNCVELNGAWYYIDVTWDDPTYEEEGVSRGISRDCFLITTEELLKTHTIGENQEVPECTSVDENYFVKSGMALSAYRFDEAAETIRKQLGSDSISLKFPNPEEADAACADLFAGQRFYEIVPEAGGVCYSVSRSGVLSIWID